MAIAESLKRFRKEFGLTQKAVAETLNKSQSAYSQYEFDYKGKPKSPSVDVVIKLANFYNISADYLLGLTDDPTPPKKRKKEIKSVETPPTNSGDNSELVELRSELAKIKSALAYNGIKL